METFAHVWLVIILIGSSKAMVHSYSTQAVDLVQRVYERMSQESVQINDILCISNSKNQFADVLFLLQQKEKYVTMQSVKQVSMQSLMSPVRANTLRKPSIILQICLKQSEVRHKHLHFNYVIQNVALFHSAGGIITRLFSITSKTPCSSNFSTISMLLQ